MVQDRKKRKKLTQPVSNLGIEQLIHIVERASHYSTKGGDALVLLISL
jgi:hypothetical protein